MPTAVFTVTRTYPSPVPTPCVSFKLEGFCSGRLNSLKFLFVGQSADATEGTLGTSNGAIIAAAAQFNELCHCLHQMPPGSVEVTIRYTVDAAGTVCVSAIRCEYVTATIDRIAANVQELRHISAATLRETQELNNTFRKGLDRLIEALKGQRISDIRELSNAQFSEELSDELSDAKLSAQISHGTADEAGSRQSGAGNGG